MTSVATQGPAPAEKITITNQDVRIYLALEPGLMAISPERFEDCKKHLQAEADAGRLTKDTLEQYARAKAALPTPVWSDF